jgi:hypothetical protein
LIVTDCLRCCCPSSGNLPIINLWRSTIQD